MKFYANSLKDYILNTLTQEDIFAHYLQIDVRQIYYCLRSKSNKICNPLRNDYNASVGFIYISGYGKPKLYMKDFADNYYDGDCFKIVGIVLKRDIYKDFKEICEHIIKNVNKRDNQLRIDKKINVKSKEKRELINIRISTREWNYNDSLYWNKLGVDKEFLKRHFVYLVDAAWINTDRPVYYYKSHDPCYAYYMGKEGEIDILKLYFPLRKRDKGLNRFFTNNISSLECINDLKKVDYLLITKSRKDSLVIKSILNNISIKNVEVTNLSSEAARITEEEYKILNKIYKKGIYSLMDYDREGIKCSNYLKRTFKIPYFFFPTCFGNKIGKNIKDFSDYTEENGVLEAEKLTLNIYNKYARLE